MNYSSLDDFLARSGAALAKGPLALIFVEDGSEVASTLSHHLAQGFAEVLVFAPMRLDLPETLAAQVRQISHDTLAPGAVVAAVNKVIASAAPGTWIYYGFNGEYLFYPFCENRSIRAMLNFHTGERRAAIHATVVDLYAPDLGTAPNGVDREAAQFDRSGYYALARSDDAGTVLERQVDIFGGLRRRFEEHVGWTRRRIDRVPLFCADKGVVMRADRSFGVEEYNTIACPWHHNLTACVASFRAAKALASNPASAPFIKTFGWSGSETFDWSSQQLLDLGLMEPGQWF